MAKRPKQDTSEQLPFFEEGGPHPSPDNSVIAVPGQAIERPESDIETSSSPTAPYGRDEIPSSCSAVPPTPPPDIKGPTVDQMVTASRVVPSTLNPAIEKRQEFFIPLSGFVWLYPEEVQVVDHPAFQRLGRIYQLGQVHLIYRGATHKRLEHALGALHMVQRMIRALEHTSDEARQRLARGERNYPCGAPLTPMEQRFVRLGALLHDIGHIAAGHTVEDELCLIGGHDEDARLDLLFIDEVWMDVKSRTLGALIDSEFHKFIPENLSDVKASEIVRLLIRKQPKDKSKDKHKPVQEVLESSDTLRFGICRDMIGNTICADLLDYLHRDWYHIGNPRPFDERILQYMEIRPAISTHVVEPKPAASNQFVISLGKPSNPRTDAVSSILELLEWRYQLAESVLFHRTKLAAAAMLDRALYELWRDQPQDLERFLLPLSDEQMLAECRRRAEGLRDNGSGRDGGRERGAISAKLLRALEERQMFTTLCSFTYHELRRRVRENIQKLYSKKPESGANVCPENRTRVLRQLESDFNLMAGSLAMYCPTAEMNKKIAEVKIAVGHEISPFNMYEDRHNDQQLAGGHLQAQLNRFERLWSVHFFIDRQEKERCGEGLVRLLRRTVQQLALGDLGDTEEPGYAAQALARELLAIQGSRWTRHQVVEHTVAARYKDPTDAFGSYPTGAPSVRSYLRRPDDAQA